MTQQKEQRIPGAAFIPGKPDAEILHTGKRTFRVSKILGQGGMGIVYLAEEESQEARKNRQPAIIKQHVFGIPEALIKSPDTVKEFIKTWQQNRSRRGTSLKDYVIGSIRDISARKTIEDLLKNKKNDGDIRTILQEWTKSKEAYTYRHELSLQLREFYREFRALDYLTKKGVMGIPWVLDDNVVTIASPLAKGTLEHFFIEEKLPGQDMAHLMADPKTRLKPPDTIAVMLNLTEIAMHGHENGIIHRDINPLNIMIEKEEKDLHIALTDFGIASPIMNNGDLTPQQDAQQAEIMKHLGMVTTSEIRAVGTPLFSAPEIVKNVADPRTDVFSLGRTLFFGLFGPDAMPKENPGDSFQIAEFNHALTAKYASGALKAELYELIKQSTNADYTKRPMPQEFYTRLKHYYDTEYKQKQSSPTNIRRNPAVYLNVA